MTAEHYIILTLDITPNTAAGWLAKGKHVDSSAKANASLFTSIAAMLGQLSTDVTELDKAQTAAANKGTKETKARNAAWKELKKSLRAARNAVQGLCDDAPDREHAESIAAAAGFGTKNTAGGKRAEFYGKALGNGAVHIYASLPKTPKKTARAFFEWEMSTDGGKTFTAIRTTNDANIRVDGLTPLTTVLFRYRVTVKNVPSTWSAAIPVLVL